MVLLVAAAQTAQAAIGTSTNYSLEVADLTNSGATATSASYLLEAAITGDTADGESYSTSYTACAGLVEEAYSDCMNRPTPPPPPPPPPPPGGGGYPHDIRPYRPPVTTQETEETQETQITQESQETQEPEQTQETQEAPTETQESQEPFPGWVTPPVQPETPTGEIPPGQIPGGQIRPDGTMMYPEFGQELWCQNGSCYGSAATIGLRPAAAVGGLGRFIMIWWPWIFILIFSFFVTIPKMTEEEMHTYSTKKRNKKK